MADFNLLPENLKPKGYTLKVSSTFKKVELIAFVFFGGALILVLAINVILSFQKNQIFKRTERLKSEIVALKETEQKLILIEDRIANIKTIEAKPNAYDEVGAASGLIQTLPTDVILKRVDIETDKTGLTVSAPSSQILTKYFVQLLNSSSPNIELTSFKYDQKSGYEVKITILSS